MVKNKLLIIGLCLFITLTLIGFASASTVNFTSPTPNPGVYLNVSSIVINATSADANLTNITINLYNATGLVNQTNLTSAPFIVNFTNLVDGIYYFNATALNSSADVINYTETRNVTIDMIYPIILINSPANDSWTSAAGITPNFNFTDKSATGYCKIYYGIYLQAFGNVTNSSPINSYGGLIPTPHYNNGSFTWYITCNDSAGNTNTSEIRTLYSDASAPAVTIIAPANNYYYSNKNFVLVLNASVNDGNGIGVNAVYFNITNSSGQVAFIQATNTTSTSWNATVNVTNYSDGSYTFTVYTNDSLNSINNTVSAVVTFDTVAPNISLESPADDEAFDTSGSSYNIGFEFNVTDASGSIANCSLIINSVMNKTETGISVNITESISQSFEEDSYSWKIRCTDSAGNIADSSDTWDFDVTTFSGSDDGGGGGGGAESSFWTMTYNVNQDSFKEEGYNRSFSKGQRMKVLIDGDTHYVGVINVSSDRAIINVSSTPQQATLNVGETKKFEVNTDGYYDISVKLNSIDGTKANLSIMYLHEKMAAVANNLTAGNGTNQTTTLTTNQTGTQGASNASAASSVKNNWKWILVGILVVVIAFIVIFWKKIWFWLSNLKHQHK